MNKTKFLLLAFAVLLLANCGPKKAKDELADTGRTKRTEWLLAHLKSLAAQGYLFGHQDATLYGIGWDGDSCRSDVKSVCGDFPAVVGFELGGIETGDSLNIDGVAFEHIRREIINQYDRGGVVTISWHALNPLTGGTAWLDSTDSIGGKPVQTVAACMEGGKAHAKFVAAVDSVAKFLKSLETPYGVRVPVIFRPWHEHTGGWFWWGSTTCTPQQYKALWQMTKERFAEAGLVNVLYAYAPGTEADGDAAKYLERYPGDDYVDVMGLDSYCGGEENDTVAYKTFAATLEKNLKMVCAVAKEHGKAAALTETGYESLRYDQWWTRVLQPVLDRCPVSYALVWRNAHDVPMHYYAPFPGQRTVTDFVAFYNAPRSFFLRDVNGLYLEPTQTK